MCIYLTDIFSSEDICSSSVECRTSPLRRFSQSSLQLHKNPYSLSTFCTEHNVQECLSHISQVGNLTSDVLLAPSFICKCSGSKICDCCAPCLNLAGPLHSLLFSFSSSTLHITGGVISWPPTGLGGVVQQQLRDGCRGCAELHVRPDSAAPQGPPNPGKHGSGAA